MMNKECLIDFDSTAFKVMSKKYQILLKGMLKKEPRGRNNLKETLSILNQEDPETRTEILQIICLKKKKNSS